MPLSDFLDQMNEFARRPFFWRAAVHIGEFRIRARVNYLPDGIEVIGAPGEWPRYIRLAETKVYLRRDLKTELTKEVAPEYYAFYTWDPRRLVYAGLFEEKQVAGTSTWRALYDAENLNPPLSNSLIKMIKHASGTRREVEYTIDKGDVHAEERLRELAVWDVSPEPTLVTLQFLYSDGK